MAPRTHRSGPWLLATAAAATISAAAALAALASALPALLGWNLAWTASAACAVAGTFAARLATTSHERRRWTWWTVASAAWLGGQLAWDVLGLSGSSASPNPADVGWWAFAILFMAGL